MTDEERRRENVGGVVCAVREGGRYAEIGRERESCWNDDDDDRDVDGNGRKPRQEEDGGSMQRDDDYKGVRSIGLTTMRLGRRLRSGKGGVEVVGDGGSDNVQSKTQICGTG